MAHYAQVQNEKVTQVIVADQEFIDSGAVGTGWLQTSYNTKGGVHYGADGPPDGGVALRKNYAGIGHTYDAEHDAFYAPQVFKSWTLNTNTFLWEPPVAYPIDENTYYWDEELVTWIKV